MSELDRLIASMTIDQLAKLGGKNVAEIAAFALTGAAPKSSASRAVNGATHGATKRAPRAGKASTRTASGRADFEQRIFDAIKAAGGPVRSVDIESKVGGTPMQRRAALHRLVKARKIKREGQARATTYAAR